MVAAGKLGHIFGHREICHREIFYIGCTLFAVASVVAGFSLLPKWLIASRFFQAIGAAIIFPLMSSTLLIHIFLKMKSQKR